MTSMFWRSASRIQRLRTSVQESRAKSPFENSPPLWCKGGMWKKEDREREAKLARKTKRYPSDLTD
ncbi:hypothetical protein, partial [Ralstonia pseudosolanacearum]|uniref:hypothetical protein n=1 Tax=Ralstonia pseudosolanacearum TaxID=1310165 RepID=UPI002005A794